VVRRSVVQKVDSLAPVAYEGAAHRHIEPSRNPLSGAGARINGGRWNPRDSFSVLYLGLTRATVDAEFERMARRMGRSTEDFLPRRFVAYTLRLASVLDLRPDSALADVGLSMADLASDDLVKCQQVGEAAHYLGLEGILAPSATSRGVVLAVFPDRLGGSSSILIIRDEIRTTSISGRPTPGGG
jgi:RES domain-containing protein